MNTFLVYLVYSFFWGHLFGHNSASGHVGHWMLSQVTLKRPGLTSLDVSGTELGPAGAQAVARLLSSSSAALTALTVSIRGGPSYSEGSAPPLTVGSAPQTSRH